MSPRAGARRTTPRAGQLPGLPARSRERVGRTERPASGPQGQGRSRFRGALSRQLRHCRSRVSAEAASPRKLRVTGSGSGQAPRRRHLNPSPPRETLPRLPLRGQVPAVEYRAASVPAIPAPQHLPIASPPLRSPPTPFPGCHRRPGSAGLGPMRAVRRLRALGRGREGAVPGCGGLVVAPAGLGGAAGGPSPQEGLWSSSREPQVRKRCLFYAEPSLGGHGGRGRSKAAAARGRSLPRKRAERPSPPTFPRAAREFSFPS